MHERIDWFAKRPAPSLAELREGADLLLDCYGESKMKPSIGSLPQPEKVLSAHFESTQNNKYEGTVFVSRSENDGCRRLEGFVAIYNPDDTRYYERGWLTDLCIEPETLEDLNQEQRVFFDEWKIKTARQILAIWEAYGN